MIGPLFFGVHLAILANLKQNELSGKLKQPTSEPDTLFTGNKRCSIFVCNSAEDG
jgi:hypothetical protein